MVNAKDCYGKFGAPTPDMERKHMINWHVPSDLCMGKIPPVIYCNKLMTAPLEAAFRNLMVRGFLMELVTWNGCFNIRKQRGSQSMSLHSWGIAVDVNAATNALGKEPTLSPGFVQCLTDAGFEWGGTWQRKDGMHFQLARI